jgi:putative transcriptional regulator
MLPHGSSMKTLKELRILHTLRQEDMAQKIDVRRETIAHWETGRNRPALRYLQPLATLFALSVEDLL